MLLLMGTLYQEGSPMFMGSTEGKWRCKLLVDLHQLFSIGVPSHPTQGGKAAEV